MTIRLRALERDDLEFVHGLNNDSRIMSYWFTEPYEALVELRDIYDRHVHDNRERRFVIEADGEPAGIVELVEIDYIHRGAEFQIIVHPSQQGRGYAREATRAALDYAFAVLNLHKVYLVVDVENAAAIHVYRTVGFVTEGELREATRAALDYAFAVLNLHKVYLVVDVENAAAIHVYRKAGFVTEGELREEFFADGRYRNALRMGILQPEYLDPGRARA